MNPTIPNTSTYKPKWPAFNILWGLSLRNEHNQIFFFTKTPHDHWKSESARNRNNSPINKKTYKQWGQLLSKIIPIFTSMHIPFRSKHKLCIGHTHISHVRPVAGVRSEHAVQKVVVWPSLTEQERGGGEKKKTPQEKEVRAYLWARIKSNLSQCERLPNAPSGRWRGRGRCGKCQAWSDPGWIPDPPVMLRCPLWTTWRHIRTQTFYISQEKKKWSMTVLSLWSMHWIILLQWGLARPRRNGVNSIQWVQVAKKTIAKQYKVNNQQKICGFYSILPDILLKQQKRWERRH